MQKTLELTTEAAFGTAGKFADSLIDHSNSKKIKYYEEQAKVAGGGVYEVVDLALGANGVRKGVKKIADTSYRFKEISSIGNKIIPSVNVAVNNVLSAEKIATAGDITNTVIGWYNKVYNYFNKNK